MSLRDSAWSGVAIALLVMGGWATSLVLLLSLGLDGLHPALYVPAVLVQTFLHTGLFITAHDSMHGAVCPSVPKLNNVLGGLAAHLYAAFSYDKLRRKHRQHHRFPAHEEDPDHHDAGRDRFWRWYLGFMWEYLSVLQVVGVAVAYNVLHHVVGVDLGALNVFWVLPSLLSTVQLFYFGTYLPHRQPPEGFEDEHRATSNEFSTVVSFLTCYHFGYHHEHHEHPHVPWWRLPAVRRRKKKKANDGRNGGAGAQQSGDVLHLTE